MFSGHVFIKPRWIFREAKMKKRTLPWAARRVAIKA
jgi:hypothetical protein